VVTQECDAELRCRLYGRYDQVNEWDITYQEMEYWPKKDYLPCSESYPLAVVDRPKEMVELTVAEQIPPRALGRNDDDFRREGLKLEISVQ
jgi:hypothetical protein